MKVDEMIRRVAEIEDELKSLGVDKLETELKELRENLKTAMMAERREKAFDEVSGWGAELVVRQKDTYVADLLEKLLTERQQQRYLRRMVDEDAVKRGLENGDLSRATLEKGGALVRKPSSVALYVKKKEAASG